MFLTCTLGRASVNSINTPHAIALLIEIKVTEIKKG